MDFNTYEKSGRFVYGALAQVVATILNAAILQTGGLRLQQLQQRAKDPASLRAKLEKVGAIQSSEIQDFAKDLAGARVVLYTNSDVSRFLSSGIISKNFDIDWDRTKIHHPPADAKQANELFISNNYAVKLKDDRVALPEYTHLGGLWCEIQVQTTLNHAWSEMAHNTIYKGPNLSGFGSELMRSIESRMKVIMRKHLAPAGYEFQKVLTDFERLSVGKELFDQGALASIEACSNNNERYDALERFAEHVLPFYDDYESVSEEVIATAAGAVKKAREASVAPIDTPFGSLPGRTAIQVGILAAGIIDQLRYVNVDSTFDIISKLYANAESNEEQEIWLKSAQALSKHELTVWKQVGPRVQILLVDRIRAMPAERRAAIRPFVLTVLAEVLGTDVSGTSSTYNAITLHQGSVNPSEELREMRAAAIDILADFYRSSADDAARREIVQAFAAASSMPRIGGTSTALLVSVLNDTRRIIQLYTDTIAEMSFELRQKIEHDLLWLYRHNGGASPVETADEAVTSARLALLNAVLAFRDRANANEDFVIYKTLVGFESVFPPAWDDPEFEPMIEEAYWDARIEELVTRVSHEDADQWLGTIRRCASTKSDDQATFLPFQKFLSKLSIANPDLIVAYLKRIDDKLVEFLQAMLPGLVPTPQWQAAEAIVRGWVAQRRYLRQVAWSLRNVSIPSAALLADILGAAVEAGDDLAVLNIVSAASARHEDPQRGSIKVTMLSAIAYLRSCLQND